VGENRAAEAAVDVLAAEGREAERRQDWAAAELLRRRAIAQDEGLVAAWTGLANALRQQGRLDEADSVLLRAIARLPPQVEHYLGHAELADRRGDWDAAEARWRAMRTLFPEVWFSYVGGAGALRALGRLAEALLAEDAARFGWEPAFPQDLGRLAAERKDWAVAETHWRAALALDGRPWWVYGEPAAALEHQGRVSEAEAALLDGQASDPAEISPFIGHANLAEKREDRVAAERRWRIVRERFPERLEGYTEHAAALRHLRQPAAAASVLDEAAERFPGDGGVRHALARQAEALSDWLTAVDHWRVALAIDPDVWWVRTALTVALAQTGRTGEAETILLDRQRSHPSEVAAFIDYARLAQERGDREISAVRWQVVLERFPDRIGGYVGVLRSWREAGRTEDAVAVLAQALRRFPESETIMLEAARLARRMGRTAEALQILALVRGHFPQLIAAYAEAAEVLRDEGRLDEAQALLSEALVRFPDPWWLWRVMGSVIEVRGDWAAAVAHWAEMSRRFPYAEDQSVRLYDALMRLAEVDPAVADAAALAQGVGSLDDALCDLALSFEAWAGRRRPALIDRPMNQRNMILYVFCSISCRSERTEKKACSSSARSNFCGVIDSRPNAE
jgi:tetratricopeptide (TPR) repeat protein